MPGKRVPRAFPRERPSSSRTHAASAGACRDSDWESVRRELRSAADSGLSEKYARVSPTCGEVLGVTVPALRQMVKDFASRSPQLEVDVAIEIANDAFVSACREEMLFAIFLIARFKRRLNASHWSSIDRWVEVVDNWETCDQLAMAVAGELIGRARAKEREQFLADLTKWSVAPNPWRRRFAVSSTTALNQKGRKNAVATLQVCEGVIEDIDKNVQAAVGWAMREASKSDAKAVFAFLKKHQKSMPPGLLRKSAEKLSALQRAALGL